jgi:hypothetical protein
LTTTITKSIQVRPDQRTIETTYVIEDTRTKDSRGDSIVAQLLVLTYHSKDHKQIVSNIVRQVRGPIFVSTAIAYGRNNPPIGGRAFHTARYSAKALADAHKSYEDILEPHLNDAIEWARGAIEEHSR